MKTSKFNMPDFSNGFKAIIAIVFLSLVGGGLYLWGPGLTLDPSKIVEAMTIDDTNVDNVTESDMLPLPTNRPSNLVASKPLNRICAYAWNAQSGILVSLGGHFTTKGSLMEQNGVNLNFVRKDGVGDMKKMQKLFIAELDKGIAQPTNEEAAFGSIMMGDGVPFYISTMQKYLDDTYGEGKYHLEVAGAIGLSFGEDQVIGPLEWKTNPQTMIGSLISVVVGDGDWVTAVNYCSVNNLPINPNLNAYDPNAVNFYNSEDDNYMNSAKELIKSQTEGWTVELDVIENGELTGETIKKEIDGCGTWTPGDDLVFQSLSGFTTVVSTKDFNNQMATTLVVVKEWAEIPANAKVVSNILKSAYTAANQMKQYDPWRVAASEVVAEVYDAQTPKFWYDMFQGQTGEKQGIPFSVGGSRVFTYADAMQYYGLTDGVNRYKSVWNQVGTYLTELNPYGFNDKVNGVTPYADAVNLYYIKNINDVDAGTAYKANYTEDKTNVMSKGEFQINFAFNSSVIQPSSLKTMNDIYNLLIQAEDAKLVVEGHTDSKGSDETNLTVSQERAESVATFLKDLGIPEARFNNNGARQVIGKGETEPIADNSTKAGQDKNRRVVITLLN